MAPFTETRDFVWNVENSVTNQMQFSYYVGEGPLYWFRIDWVHSPCPENTCASFTPVVSYTDVNCPYDVSIPCTKLPADPDCPCDVTCQPGALCASQMVEVWHMMATSVTHLCERINSECCHKKPMKDYYIKRVQQWMRPALCCDVNNNAGSDTYVDVDFTVCECGNLVHPCVARFVYPCSINNCGINGPAFPGPDPLPPSTIKMAPEFMFTPEPLVEEVKPVPIKQLLRRNQVEKQGFSIPEVLHCNHNIDQTAFFGDFLKRIRQNFNNLDLFYNKEYDSWHGSKSFKEGNEDWKVLIDWTPASDGYKLNLSVDKRLGQKTVRTKATWAVKSDIQNRKGVFVDLETGLLKSKNILDNIGIFKNWKNELKFNLRG